MTLAMIGLNFRTAPVELRENLTVPVAELTETLRRLVERLPDTELVLLSTCNRTELYAAAPGIEERGCSLMTPLLESRAATGLEPAGSHFYRKSGVEAAAHLFRVACGLESMVAGETGVLGQLREAYRLATLAHTTGGILNPLFHRAFRVAKRVHTETDIARGRVSVSSIAVEFAEKVFDDLASKTIIVVGAGETGELTLKSLMDRGVRDVVIVNRSLERGEALAERYAGKAIQFDLLGDYLPRADIVISSTSSPDYVITADAVRNAVSRRHNRPTLLIDIAVPRDIDPAAGRIENVYLYNIDDLQKIAEENLTRRKAAMEEARRVVQEEVAALDSSSRAKGLDEIMKRLEESVLRIRDEELEQAMSREHMAPLPEQSREEVRRVVNRTVNRILAQPRKALHEAARNGRWTHYAKVALHLFGLGQEEGDKHDEP